jgi:hypothetical protein
MWVKGRLNDANNLGMFMMMDDVTFFMGGQVVGEFPWSLLPTMDGSYSYEPYRAPGHVNLHIELWAGIAPLCFYKSGAQRVSFCVIASPAQGLLTLAGFEVVDDQ